MSCISSLLPLYCLSIASAADKLKQSGDFGGPDRSYAYDIVRTDSRTQTLDAFLRAPQVCSHVLDEDKRFCTNVCMWVCG